jgi:membrane-bound lytic murein transglycosylase C
MVEHVCWRVVSPPRFNSSREDIVVEPVRTLSIALGAVLLIGCQTLEKAVRTTEQGLSLAQSGSVQTLTNIAKADDPESAIKAGLASRREAYKDNPMLAVKDIKAIKRDFNRLMNLLEGNVSRQWGKQETRLPSRKQYVKYTQNYNSRAVVDFDKGLVTVETVDVGNPHASLKNAIVTTLLTPDDPRAVDLFSDTEIKLDGTRPPYLLNLVLDNKGKAITTPQRAEEFADYLLTNSVAQRQVNMATGNRQAHYVTVEMVSNFSHTQAEKYRPLVERYAGQYNISPSLVYAVMRTESNFNPFAVSPVPAYGLMQLVPASGGRDAYRQVHGKDGVPSKQYLFEPDNNIELGTAYLNLLEESYLSRVQNETSREYCVISAYNTGAGNVLRTFSRDRDAAFDAINGLQPPEVYNRLRKELPYVETRQYLGKVVNFRKQFVAL